MQMMELQYPSKFQTHETIENSASIRWNMGDIQWTEPHYLTDGMGVVRVVDPDMNLNSDAVDQFKIDVWSDSDGGGIDLIVMETNDASGIFEGVVFFTTTEESIDHRLRVSERDTITAEYEENTLPIPFKTTDELDIAATTYVADSPYDRCNDYAYYNRCECRQPAARVVDAFGNPLDTVSVDQQIQITADLVNCQNRDQRFAYFVQIKNDD